MPLDIVAMYIYVGTVTAYLMIKTFVALAKKIFAMPTFTYYNTKDIVKTKRHVFN